MLPHGVQKDHVKQTFDALHTIKFIPDSDMLFFIPKIIPFRKPF